MKYTTDKASKIPAKIRNVMEVPTAGMEIKVGTNVPIMLPIVLNAPNVPTVCPLSSRLSTEYFTREGVTVPSKNKGNTKITMQAANAAMMRKLLLTVKIQHTQANLSNTVGKLLLKP